ncbi:unnamed protein product [Xylocopa violacea]|uniref:Uncharacterized protein n=1 Tax=Xylocopa violacea TaxID=135666 RepID=A0ABP1P7P4_XYLVO
MHCHLIRAHCWCARGTRKQRGKTWPRRCSLAAPLKKMRRVSCLKSVQFVEQIITLPSTSSLKNVSPPLQPSLSVLITYYRK